MRNLGTAYSSEKPKEYEVVGDQVFVSSDAEQVEQDTGFGSVQMWKYELQEYSVSEFIEQLAGEVMKIHNLEDELQAAKILLGVE